MILFRLKLSLSSSTIIQQTRLPAPLSHTTPVSQVHVLLLYKIGHANKGIQTYMDSVAQDQPFASTQSDLRTTLFTGKLIRPYLTEKLQYKQCSSKIRLSE